MTDTLESYLLTEEFARKEFLFHLIPSVTLGNVLLSSNQKNSKQQTCTATFNRL